MQLKTKQFIAREGLVISFFIFLAIGLLIAKNVWDMYIINPGEDFWLIIGGGYFLYGIVKFIIWAIKTLQKKEK